MAKGVASRQWVSLLSFGEIVALDEKLRRFRGASPCMKKMLSKPDRIGQMVTMLATYLENGSIPFVCGFFPYMASKVLGWTASAAEIARWACDLVDLGSRNGHRPVLVADCLYHSEASRAVYSERSQPYVMAMKVGSWSGMEELLSSAVQTTGDTAYAYQVRTDIVCCHHYSLNRDLGKKYVVSTAHQRTRAAEIHCVNLLLYAEYAATFAAVDQVNRALHDCWWPFRSQHWERHFESVFLSMALMNIYADCLDLGLVVGDGSFKATIRGIGMELVQIYFKK